MSNGITTLPTESKPPPLGQALYSPPTQPTPPGTYPPSPHDQTHISSDLVPIVTTSSPGLTPQLSANPNTWLNGNGAYTTPPGTPLNMKGTVSTSSALPSTGNALNDFWVASDTGHGWAWNGTAWVDMGPFQGPPGVAGPAGGAGPAGPAGSTGQGYTWLGAWNSVTAYVPYQTVSYQGSSYVCIAGNTNQLPTNTTYWNIIAQIGGTGGVGPAGPPGSAGSAGPQGQPGQAAYSLTTAQVTIPAAGSTTTVTLSSVAWANIGDYVSVQGAAGSGQSAVLQITAINTGTNTLTLLNPVQGGGIPPASNSQAGLLNQLSGNASDFVDGTNTCQNLVTAIQPVIWSVRLRSYNAIGNPTFEVDQRTVGAGTGPTGNIFGLDRWVKGGQLAANYAVQQVTGVPVILPGTNFAITRNFVRILLLAQKATLAAGDFMMTSQNIEGPRLRELINDVHSVSILCRSSVAPLTFAVPLRDSVAGYSLIKLLTVSTANVWMLLALPNLLLWTASGNFPLTPGNVGYSLGICLAAGSNFQTTPDVWATGNFLGAASMGNFAASAVNSTFDVAFIQHEPGALCTTPIDCPFQQNYDDSLRYYQKSYDYGTAAGTVASIGRKAFMAMTASAAQSYGSLLYPRPMAKIPTITIYNDATGAANSVRDAGGVDHASATASAGVGVSGFSQVGFTTGVTSPIAVLFQYTADTGW